MGKSVEEEKFLAQRDGLALRILGIITEAEPQLTINQALSLLDYSKGYILNYGRLDLVAATVQVRRRAHGIIERLGLEGEASILLGAGATYEDTAAILGELAGRSIGTSSVVRFAKKLRALRPVGTSFDCQQVKALLREGHSQVVSYLRGLPKD